MYCLIIYCNSSIIYCNCSVVYYNCSMIYCNCSTTYRIYFPVNKYRFYYVYSPGETPCIMSHQQDPGEESSDHDSVGFEILVNKSTCCADFISKQVLSSNVASVTFKHPVNVSGATPRCLLVPTDHDVYRFIQLEHRRK